MSKPTETRVMLWEAINLYVSTCGGKPDQNVYGNTSRQLAVVAVEKCIEAERAEAVVERIRRIAEINSGAEKAGE